MNLGISKELDSLSYKKDNVGFKDLFVLDYDLEHFLIRSN
jgi:hypothetical protein